LIFITSISVPSKKKKKTTTIQGWRHSERRGGGEILTIEKKKISEIYCANFATQEKSGKKEHPKGREKTWMEKGASHN